jgi:hypothetical protein
MDRSSSPVQRLGFKEIVPGSDPASGSEETTAEGGGPPSQVPRFDLDAGIMANDRRLVAATRRGPGRRRDKTSDSDVLHQASEAVHEAPRPAEDLGDQEALSAATAREAIEGVEDADNPGEAIPGWAEAALAAVAARQEAVPPEPPCPEPPLSEGRSIRCPRVWRPVMPDPQRSVIAAIVARDIDRLCRAERTFFA